ncbi:caspase family protein [Pseudorhodoferax sp.]|uniref:caspase family protein n=1 Tax=Pseudorhodoferax sp. TaxID=1993553 RepID=UPI0039E58B66
MGNRRTTSASSIGDDTLAVVIGLSRHAHAGIEALPAASVETREIRDALTDPRGCRLRPDHVECLCDEAATREAVLVSIGSACRQATSEQTLFLYFAGHGADVDEQFVLVAYDTDTQDLSGTGVSARELDELLRGTRARGVFLVLDCCGGAALAEGAPGFFRIAGASANHRILLSAARAGQVSREGPRGSAFSVALIDALTGREPLSDQNGAIYFSDLYRFLHDRVTVAGESEGGAGNAQEPMATATYARDPLLFLHAGLTLAQVQVRTQRYSRKQLRAMLLRGLLGTSAVVAIAVLALWAYLAAHHFLRLEGGVLALYRGHPALRVLAYPRLVWQYDLQADEIDAASPLAKAQPVVSDWGQDFRDEPLRHLNAVGRARWFAGADRLKEARAEVAALAMDGGAGELGTKAALLAAGIATAEDVPLLESLTRSPRQEVVTAALTRLMQVSPENGARLAEAMGFGQGTRGVHLQVLAELPPGCSPATQRYLDGFGAGPANGQFARLQIDVALRTGCRLSDTAIASIGQPLYLGLVASYLAVADPARGAGLQQLFLQALAAQVTGEGARVSLNAAAGYLAGAPPSAGACPEVRSLEHLAGIAARLMAARALVRQCPAFQLGLSAAPGGATIRVDLVRDAPAADPLGIAELRFDSNVGDLMLALDTLRARGAAHSSAVLEQLASSHGNPGVRLQAVRLLRLAGVPPKGAFTSYEATGDQALQAEAYLWLAQADRAEVLARVRSRLGDDTAEFLPMTVARLGLSLSEAQEMLRAADSAKVGERTRAALIAILGEPPAVARQLASPDAKQRAWTADWLAVRRDLAVISELLPNPPRQGQLTARSLQQVEARRAALAHELGEQKPQSAGADDSWRIKLMLDMRQIPDSGLRAWLQARCRWCD